MNIHFTSAQCRSGGKPQPPLKTLSNVDGRAPKTSVWRQSRAKVCIVVRTASSVPHQPPGAFPCLCPLRAPRCPTGLSSSPLSKPRCHHLRLSDAHTPCRQQPAGMEGPALPQPNLAGVLVPLECCSQARGTRRCGMHRVPAHMASARVSWHHLQESVSRL